MLTQLFSKKPDGTKTIKWFLNKLGLGSVDSILMVKYLENAELNLLFQ
jgi:hypothetical protein